MRLQIYIHVHTHTHTHSHTPQVKSGVKIRHLRSLLIDAIKHVKSCPVSWH